MKRAKVIRWCFMIGCLGLIGYLGYLMFFGVGGKTVRTAGARTRTTDLYALKGTIYDYRLRPITNATACYYLLVDPRNFPRDQTTKLCDICDISTEELNGKLGRESAFVLTSSLKPEPMAGLYCFEGNRRYGDIADHLVGYINGDLEGVSGLEKSYNSVLSYFKETKNLRFAVDGKSNPLIGLGITVEGEDRGMRNGVITTLDLDIQTDLERAMDQYVPKGAAVVLDIHSGEIRALVSRPDFDAGRVAEYLSSPDGELINRALSAQTVGSVFKIAVAAAAIENKLDVYECTCTGSITVGDRSFTCPVADGHGEMNLQTAFSESCNTYFIALGQMLGTDKVMEITRRLGFGESMEIAQNLYASAGVLPDVTGNPVKQLANFSIGQGDFTASPLQIARLVALCGNGGYLVEPTCFQGFYVDETVKSEQWVEYSTRVIAEETAEKLRNLCIGAVNDGTGTAAAPKEGGAGDKTSSAQTGRFDADGREILNTYFAGFYPAEQPDYAIAVFALDGISGGKTCAPVFREVSNGIAARKND